MVSQLPIVSLASTNGINHVLWVETEKTARPCPWPHSPGKQMDLNLRAALGGTRQDSSLSPLPPLHPLPPVLGTFPKELAFRLPWEGGSHSLSLQFSMTPVPWWGGVQDDARYRCQEGPQGHWKLASA